jgi:hypothetical protein
LYLVGFLINWLFEKCFLTEKACPGFNKFVPFRKCLPPLERTMRAGDIWPFAGLIEFWPVHEPACHCRAAGANYPVYKRDESATEAR